MKFLKKDKEQEPPTREQIQEIENNLTKQEAKVLLELLRDKEAKKLAFDYLLSNVSTS